MEANKKAATSSEKLYFMILKSILSKRKLMIKCSKTATKALTSILIKSNTNLDISSVEVELSCTNTSSYNPVELSCTNTSSYNPVLPKKRNQGHECCNYEFYNYESSDSEYSVASSSMWGLGKSLLRKVRVTDSPFPIKEEEELVRDGSRVDKLADEFIKRFYEQLKLQQQIAMTPKYEFHR